MIAYIKEYWILCVILVVALIAMIYVWYRALKAAAKRQRRKDALIAQLEHEKKLREDFATLTPALLETTPSARLVEGVCTHIQMGIEKQADLNAAFDALTEEERLVYALGYVVQDGRKGLMHFFHANGKPLTPVARTAVEQFLPTEISKLFNSMYDAFDDENESVSYIEEKLQKLDEKYLELTKDKEDEVFRKAADFIRENSEMFVK